MAKSVLDIVIKLSKEGGADKETVAGLTKLKAGIGEATAVAGGLVAAGYALNQAYQATVVVFENYANQVRDVSRETGMSAEESSRLIQASDDLTIKYDDLKKSLYEMAKRGQEPSIENLKKMGDEYLALAPGVERVKYLTDNFGKSGAQMGKLLEQGSAGIEKYTRAVDGNLILTDKQLAQARQLEVAQDNLADTWQGLAIQIGAGAVPALNAWLTLISKGISATDSWKSILTGLLNPMQGLVELTHAYGDTYNELQANATNATGAIAAQTPVLAENAEQIKANSDANKSLLDLTLQMQSAEDAHRDRVADLRAKMAELNVEYRTGKIDIDEYNKKKGELSGALDKEAKAFEDASKRIVFSLLQQRLASDGLNDKEMKMLLNVGEGMGLIDAKTATAAKSINDNIALIDTDKPEVFKSIMTDIFHLPDEKAMKMTLENFDTDTTGQVASDLTSINELPDEVKKKFIITFEYPNGPPPDLPEPDPTTPTTPTGANDTANYSSNRRMGSIYGGSSAAVASGATGGAASAVSGGGGRGITQITIQHMTVQVQKGMTQDDFIELISQRRE